LIGDRTIIPVGDLKPGAYLLKVISNEGATEERFIKE
jgi:hypothetical protein